MARIRQTTSSGRSVLVIDDNEEYLTSTARLLAREGHEVLTAPGGNEALQILRARGVDLVLVDYFMPSMTGEQFVEELRKFRPHVQVILQTGYASERPPREMLRRLDIQGYHDKSEGPDKLLLWVDVGLRSAFTVQLLNKSRLGLSYILGVTPELHKIQPLEQLLHGVLVQTVGLLGAVDSFLAVANGPMKDASTEDGFLAMQAGGTLRIRASTGKFAGAETVADVLPHDEMMVMCEAARGARGPGVQPLAGGTIVPLQVGGACLGMIYVDRSVVEERDTELLAVFANQAAVAIHNASLYEIAAVDQLTRVYTRRFFEHALLRELRSAYREGRGLAVLLVDLDDMKSLNDRGGHAAGDQALAAVGGALRNATRSTDVVGRYGGDEFAIVLTGTDALGTQIVVDRILGAMKGLFIESAAGEPMPVTLTIGAVVLAAAPPTHAPHSSSFFDGMARRLVASADAQLYQGKSAGKARGLAPAVESWPSVSSPPSASNAPSGRFGVPLLDESLATRAS